MGVGGGSLRARHSHYNPSEQESLLSPPPFLSRRLSHSRARRALSLDLPEPPPAPGPPNLPPPSRNKSVSGGPAGLGGGGEHHDCNGRTHTPQPPLLAEVFPQLNTKERARLEEEMDYVSPAPRINNVSLRLFIRVLYESSFTWSAHRWT